MSLSKSKGNVSPDVVEAAGVTVVSIVLGAAILGGTFLVMLPLRLLHAWVMVKIWGWYIVPAFGLAPLALGTAFGIRLMLGFLMSNVAHEEKADFKGISGMYLKGITVSVITLAFGWLGTFVF